MPSQSVDTTQRASWWSVVINNPTEQDRQTVHGPAPRWLKNIKGQDEIGESGTLHMQLCLNTDQCRFSSIKEWLPRANIHAAMTTAHINNLKNYVFKEDTAVANTRFEHSYRAANEALTMAQVLTQIAELAYDNERYQRLLTEVDDRGLRVRTTRELHEREFWDAANMLIAANENLVALLTQPQYIRAWIHTRPVWVAKVAIDRQTDVTIHPVENILVRL